MRFQLNLSPRSKRIAKWVGYPVLGIVSFLFALQMTFPYGRLKRKITDALASKYDVTMTVDRGFMPGTVIFSKVALTSRRQKPDDKITTIFIDKITAHLGVLNFITSFGSSASIDYDVRIGGGDVAGNLGLTATRTQISLDIDKVSAETVPGIADFVGLPMGGRIEGSATIDLPAGDWRQAEAKISLGCTSNCTIGDGVAKIYPKPRPGQPQLDGVTVAKLFLGQWHAEFVVTKGHADLTKFDVKSDDGELYVDFHVQIQRAIMESPITQGCIKFKGSEPLRKRDEKFFNALNLTGAPLGPDGYHYIKLAGTLGNMRRLPQLCDLNGGGSTGTPDAQNPGIDTTGHIARPPTIRTEGLDTNAPPRPVPTYVPPQPVPVPPAPVPTGGLIDAGAPEAPVGIPGPQIERVHSSEIPEGGSGTGAPVGSDQSPPITGGSGTGTAGGPGTGGGSGTGINVP